VHDLTPNTDKNERMGLGTAGTATQTCAPSRPPPQILLGKQERINDFDFDSGGAQGNALTYVYQSIWDQSGCFRLVRTRRRKNSDLVALGLLVPFMAVGMKTWLKAS
jgi:hypothetical protein